MATLRRSRRANYAILAEGGSDKKEQDRALVLQGQDFLKEKLFNGSTLTDVKQQACWLSWMMLREGSLLELLGQHKGLNASVLVCSWILYGGKSERQPVWTKSNQTMSVLYNAKVDSGKFWYIWG